MEICRHARHRKLPSVWPSDHQARFYWIMSFAPWELLKRSGLFGGRIRRRAKERHANVRARAVLPQISDGTFVQLLHEVVEHRSPLPTEIAEFQRALAAGTTSRNRLVADFFNSRASGLLEGKREDHQNDLSRIPLAGTDRFVTPADWDNLVKRSKSASIVPAGHRHSRFPFVPSSGVEVSAIASLYRGGQFIRRFLENITAQTIFDRSELIIIDANSPEREQEIIEPYCKKFPNIKYIRTADRIGIYEAWNLAIASASGKYVTNVNLDDLRRKDSFELQAATLNNLDFIDVVYQDFFYALDPALDFDQAAAFQLLSDLPIVCANNLIGLNSPHNAPMWRRKLHEEIGEFEAEFSSAGDWEFWIRCLLAGKKFYKLNDPHVLYYVNPDGVSTKPATKGFTEGNRITRTYGRKLLSRQLVGSDSDLLKDINQHLGRALGISNAQRATRNWRYQAAQLALRQLSRESRSSRSEHA